MPYYTRLARLFFILFLSIFFLDVVLFWGRMHTQPQRIQVLPSEGKISINGILLCLPHKNGQGPQTMECAYGLKDSEGNYYGLQDSDVHYKNITSHSVNTPILVNGSFEPKKVSQYPIIGVITVDSIVTPVSPSF